MTYSVAMGSMSAPQYIREVKAPNGSIYTWSRKPADAVQLETLAEAEALRGQIGGSARVIRAPESAAL